MSTSNEKSPTPKYTHHQEHIQLENGTWITTLMPILFQISFRTKEPRKPAIVTYKYIKHLNYLNSSTNI